MANHKSSEKRIRQEASRKVNNRYAAKSTRTAVKKLRTTTTKKEAADQLPKVNSLLDKLAKKNQIHKNKAANLKSKMAKMVNKLT